MKPRKIKLTKEDKQNGIAEKHAYRGYEIHIIDDNRTVEELKQYYDQEEIKWYYAQIVCSDGTPLTDYSDDSSEPDVVLESACDWLDHRLDAPKEARKRLKECDTQTLLDIFYSYATSVAAAKKEAAYVVNVLQKYKGVFTYPVAFDLEDKTQQGLGKTVLTDMVIAFGDAIEKAGFYCSLYSNLNWLKNYLDDSKLKRFDHWLAQWASAPTYTGAFGMWQSSSTGKVSGINGNVDTDIAYKDYPTIIKNAKLNGFTNSDQTPTVPTQPEPLPSVSFKKGDLVKITGTKYYGGQTIPAWVKAKNWYVLQANGSRVVIDKSEDGKNAICSPVNAADLKLINAKPTKTVDELAREVIRGLWGNGTDRKNRLTAAGYDYYAVQARVNELLR